MAVSPTDGSRPVPEPDDGEQTLIEPLGCGRDAATVWDKAEAGLPLDPHERDCPHCQAAFADARGLEAVVTRFAAVELQPPSSVMERVMTAVVAELRPFDTVPLPSPHGPAAISRPAVAAVLRHMVDQMSGLRARSCRIERAPAGADAPGGRGSGAAHVTITVAARFGVDLTSATARVRQMILAAGEQTIGLPVTRVDIQVVDVLMEAADGPGYDGPDNADAADTDHNAEDPR